MPPTRHLYSARTYALVSVCELPVRVHTMPPLPPLDCLRFFDAAARHQSFVRAAEELEVTSAAVAYRVKVLEDRLGHTLFDRSRRGVALNARGQAWFADVQRILADLGEAMHRHRNGPSRPRVKLVAVESVAERWLMPRLSPFYATRPDIAIELETDPLRIDPNCHDFDLWITYDTAVRAPRAETAHRETLFEETMVPVCSPALLEVRGRPRRASDLQAWPLLYHLGWPSDWAHWFAALGEPGPDLSQASGFRLCRLLVQAAVQSLGVTIGHPTVIAPELERGALVPLFRDHSDARTRCCLITTAAARHKPEVQALRQWLLPDAAGRFARTSSAGAVSYGQIGQ